MDEMFKKSLDRIKAEERLKENTKAFVRAALEESATDKTNSAGVWTAAKRAFSVKRLRTAATAAALCMVLAAGGYALYGTPVNYLSLDINPSIELGVNVFDRVVRVKASNGDGEKLLAAWRFSDMTVEEAVNALVQRAAEQGYVASDGSTVVAITAESRNEDKAAQLADRGENGVGLAMSSKNLIAVVYKDCGDLSLRTEAAEAGIPPGIFKIIKLLQTLDPDIAVEQYKDAKVSDIISEANQLIRDEFASQETEELEEASERIRETVRRMNETKEKSEEKQEQGQEEKQKENNGRDQGKAQVKEEEEQSREKKEPPRNNIQSTPQQQEQEQNRNNEQAAGSRPAASQNKEQEQNSNGPGNGAKGKETNKKGGDVSGNPAAGSRKAMALD